jgi:hypothetical protein
MSRMERPSFDVLSFLTEPGRPASVATVTGRGQPALAMMWFAVEDGQVWFHSPRDDPAPFLRAAERNEPVAVMVATFSPPDDVRQVRMTGPARLASARDDERVRRIYERYVPAWTPDWAGQATSENYCLWSMAPHRGMAVAYPGLAGGPPFHWSSPDSFPAPGTDQELN